MEVERRAAGRIAGTAKFNASLSEAQTERQSGAAASSNLEALVHFPSQ